MYFETFILTILFKNTKLKIKKKKKKKATQVFQNFGSVRKGQTNFFFLGLIKFVISFSDSVSQLCLQKAKFLAYKS